MGAAIPLATDQVSGICRRYRVKRLAVFGSALHGKLGPGSDLDLLVEFEADAAVGLFALTAMELELTELIGRRVDLNTPGFLSEEFRDKVLAEAETVYVAG